MLIVNLVVIGIIANKVSQINFNRNLEITGLE